MREIRVRDSEKERKCKKNQETTWKMTEKEHRHT